MKKSVSVVSLLIMVILVGVFYYFSHPAINIHQTSFWGTLFFISLIFAVISVLYSQIKGNLKIISKGNRIQLSSYKELSVISKIFIAVCVAIVLIFIVGNIAGSSFFRARSYASLLPVKEYKFEKDMEETNKVTDIALMDTDSAKKFGNRKIGSLSDVVSQYEVEDDYTQISVDKTPFKVSSLKYASFFKWWNNKDTGIPGYVKVDPVNSEAKYVKLKRGMKYVPSAYFNYNLQRHVQLNYPLKIISEYHFEIDDDGNPYYICPTITARVGLFGGRDVEGVIVCNPVDGDCKYYSVSDIPKWVDSAYDGHLLSQKYDWYGTLSGGFWNSIIGQKGCKVCTDDFGYKIIGDDVWVYTGVTSVNGDQSNIGFILMNQRTSEAKYYKVSGAEEHSAMDSAEGAVQEKGYRASFPSLINVSGTPSYIMVLKDAAGLVKMYAMVNVEQYNIVATATSQTEVFSKYRKMLMSNGEVKGSDKLVKEANIKVSDIKFIDTEDGTMVYIKDTSGNVFKQPFKDNEQLILISVGDYLNIKYEESEDGINILNEFKIMPK